MKQGWISRREFLIVSSLLALIGMLVTLFVFESQWLVKAVAASTSDTDPPHVVSFDFSPRTVNPAYSDQLITFTVHLTDDLSGVSHGSVPSQGWFRSPSGAQFAIVTFNPLTDLVSGDMLDGIYVNTMLIPQYSEAGVWSLDHLSLYDNVGNQRTLHIDDMMALGFPVELVITDTLSDTDPPHVVEFDFAPKTVDPIYSDQLVTFTVHLTDDLSGVTYGSVPSQVWFRSPSGSQFAIVAFNPLTDLVSGDMLDGVYVNTMLIPRYSEAGTWHLSDFFLYDNVRNTRTLDNGDMVSLGFPVHLMIEGDVWRAFLPILRK